MKTQRQCSVISAVSVMPAWKHMLPVVSQDTALRCFFMTDIGESPVWLILSQRAPPVRVVYKEVARTKQVYTHSVFVDDKR